MHIFNNAKINYHKNNKKKNKRKFSQFLGPPSRIKKTSHQIRRGNFIGMTQFKTFNLKF